jgi:hypothetical protein
MQRQHLPNPAKGDPPVAWRRHLKVHPAADFFPCMKDVDPEAFDALVRDIDTNGLHTPVVLFEENGKEKLLDGRNRLDALARLGRVNFDQGRLHIERDIDDGGCFDPVICRHARSDQVSTGCDPYAFALSLNVHRRHLTSEQKRDLVAAVLKAKPEISDRTIGKQVKVDGKTVAAVRTDLEERAEIPHVKTRTDTKGRKQPAKRTKAAKQVEADDPQASAEAMKAAPAPAVAEAVEPGDNVEEAGQVRVNALDSIENARAVAGAWRKIFKASSFDAEAKKEISDAIESLIRKWRAAQSTLAEARS